MRPQITLQRPQLADFRTICALDSAQLSEALSELKQLPKVPMLPGKVVDLLSKQLQLRPAEALFRQLLSMHGAVRQLDLDTNEVFSALAEGLQKSDPKWTDEDSQRWNEISDIIKEFFDLEAVKLSAKALDLAYEHPELLQRARILTDTRPIFDDSGAEIRGMVVSHSLMLRYDDTEGDHILSLALDEDDIYSLMQQCERALKKAHVIKDQLQTKANIAIIIPGEGEQHE